MTADQVTAANDIPDFPMRRACPYHPPAEYKTIRESDPLCPVKLYDGRRALLVTRYEDVRALFADDARLSSNRDSPEFPLMAEREKLFPEFSQQLFGLDGDEHRRRQRMLLPKFTARQVEKLRPMMQQMTDALVDDMVKQEPPVDLIAAVGRPLPSMTIAQLFGVPYEDHEHFEAWYRGIMEAPDLDEAADAGQRLIAYLDELISRKEAAPADDLLSSLITERMHTGELSRGDLSRLAIAVLAAGSEATASMIGLGMLTLLEHPDQFAVLCREEVPIAQAVDELLRFLSTADLTTSRIAVADVPLHDQVIRAGDRVIMSTAAANRDPAVFNDPDTLNLRRRPRNHLAFGFGSHRCIGENFGRIELEVVFGTLARRLPTLRLAKASEQISQKENATLEGMLELPVSW